MASFVDRVTLHASAGKGGDGCISVHREKFVPLGGPDGGSGGRGGDVILVVDANVTTLLDFHHSPHRNASSGRQGHGSLKNGADGEDLILGVPNGTVVLSPQGVVLADLVGVGSRFVAAKGGLGGLGNAALASSRRRAPGFALLGEPGEKRTLILELKSVADIGLIGFPSAGKSSLIAAADLSDRPRIIALNKVDLPDGKAMADMVEQTFRERGYEVFQISAAARIGLQELLYAMARLVSTYRANQVLEEKTRIVLRPTPVDDAGFTVSVDEDGTFTVVGTRPERWVHQTNFSNPEAVGYLADRLASLGVERELFRKGAKEGDEVRIGNGDDAVVFDWHPTIEAGAELLAGPRGDDMRIPRGWEKFDEEAVDQLDDDELAAQWEYQVSDPTSPRVEGEK
ncbi:MAG: GTPase Obg [Actinobacteria bacterium]|nr:GTPase Obg [Actinomycetota bacterium]